MSNSISVHNFIHDEFKEFSSEDNVRSIPSIIDGFKDAQRKVIYGMTLFGSSKEKVSRLSSKIAVETNYSHGETSLSGTIVGLAQIFPGANNINLLEPLGQFGTRLDADAASERYISTMKSSWFSQIIRDEDQILLKYKQDEGIAVEPECYYPILPLWLVNGTDGIGTGFASSIYPRNPREVAKLIGCIIRGEKVSDSVVETALLPWFRDWKGLVKQLEFGRYEFHGCYEIVNTTTVKITELPVGYSVDKFKSILIDLLDKNVIKDYDNNSKETGFEFIVTVPRDFTKLDNTKIMNTFKLITRGSDVPTLWNTSGKIVRYDNVWLALQEFCSMRISKFAEWKDIRLQQYCTDIERLQCKADFVKTWVSTPDIHLMSSHEIEKLILEKNPTAVMMDMIKTLMSMPIRQLTSDKIQELDEQIKTEVFNKTDLEQRLVQDLYKEAIQPVSRSKAF